MTAGSEGVVSVTLKPCPFCGASDGRLVQAFTRATEDFAYWSVECLDCGCEIADDESQAQADVAWNRRPDAALADQRDERGGHFAGAGNMVPTDTRGGESALPQPSAAATALAMTATPEDFPRDSYGLALWLDRAALASPAAPGGVGEVPAIRAAAFREVATMIRRWIDDPVGTLLVDVDEGLEADTPTLGYVVDLLEAKANKVLAARPPLSGESSDA